MGERSGAVGGLRIFLFIRILGNQKEEFVKKTKKKSGKGLLFLEIPLESRDVRWYDSQK